MWWELSPLHIVSSTSHWSFWCKLSNIKLDNSHTSYYKVMHRNVHYLSNVNAFCYVFIAALSNRNKIQVWTVSSNIAQIIMNTFVSLTYIGGIYHKSLIKLYQHKCTYLTNIRIICMFFDTLVSMYLWSGPWLPVSLFIDKHTRHLHVIFVLQIQDIEFKHLVTA